MQDARMVVAFEMSQPPQLLVLLERREWAGLGSFEPSGFRINDSGRKANAYTPSGCFFPGSFGFHTVAFEWVSCKGSLGRVRN